MINKNWIIKIICKNDIKKGNKMLFYLFTRFAKDIKEYLRK